MAEDKVHTVNGITRQHFEDAIWEAASKMTAERRAIVPGLIEGGWLNLCFVEKERAEQAGEVRS